MGLVTTRGMTAGHSKLVKMVGNLATGLTPGIPVGPNKKDVYGRQLDIRSESFYCLFSSNGQDVSPAVKEFLTRIQSEDKFRLGIQSMLAGYDIRGKDIDEVFWVLLARAYAKTLVDKTGKRDGHIIHVGQDCFDRHHRVTSIFAITLIKSGVCDNGGGIVYWGATDGGTMKAMGTLERAQTGENGNWAYGTVSHKTAPGLTGLKIGMLGGVVCTDDLKAAIFDPMVKGNFLPLKEVTEPEAYVVTVDGDTTPYYIALAERMIRARTALSARTATEDLLAGLPVGISRDGNPLMRRMEQVLGALGAEIAEIDNFYALTEPQVVRDPHEHNSAGVLQLSGWLAKDGRPLHIPYVDPDGDRVGIISFDANGQAVNLKGTALLKIAMHNLATHNPDEFPIEVVADMRALMSARRLGEALSVKGYPINVIPGVPGYNMFHLAIAANDAVLGVEDTSHTMIRPSTHQVWGAPVHYAGTQGGDNAGLFGVYLLSLAARMTEHRSLAAQLAFLHSQFQVPHTSVYELKPAIPQSHGMAKVAVAEAIRDLAATYFGGNPNFTLSPFDTGVCLESLNPAAAILVRYSKSGSGFTVGGEVAQEDETAHKFAQDLGVALLMQAERDARITMSDPAHPFHPIHDFELALNDVAPIAAGISDPKAVLTEAAEIGGA